MPGRLVRLFLTLPFLLASALLAADHQAVIIRSTGPRGAMRQAVEALGGTVNHEFQNVNAVAARVPVATLKALGAMPDFKVTKDEQVAAPVPAIRAG